MMCSSRMPGNKSASMTQIIIIFWLSPDAKLHLLAAMPDIKQPPPDVSSSWRISLGKDNARLKRAKRENRKRRLALSSLSSSIFHVKSRWELCKKEKRTTGILLFFGNHFIAQIKSEQNCEDKRVSIFHTNQNWARKYNHNKRHQRYCFIYLFLHSSYEPKAYKGSRVHCSCALNSSGKSKLDE